MGESLSALYLRDPESAAILRRQAMAQQLARAQNDPIMYRSAASPWVAGLQALAGNLGSMQAERDLGALNERRDGEANEWRRNAMAGLLSGQGAPPAASASPTPPAAPARMGGAAIPAVQRENLPPAQAPADLAPLIEEASRETGIPVPVLTAKIRQESNFRPDAVGRAGEVGLAQIMPATARQPGFGMQGVDPATLRDPRENILFGARYLAARGRAAGVTDWNDPAQVDRALAAYNGGGDPNYVQNVRRWMPQDGAATPASAPGQPAAPQVPGAPPGMTREALIPMIMDGMNSRNPRIREEAQRMAQVAQLLPQPSQRTFTTAAPGSALIDPRTGQIVGQVPERPSDAQRDQARWRELSARADTLTEAEQEERRLLAQRIAGGGVNVSVDTRAETAEATGRGRSLAEEGERVRLAAETAAQTIDGVRQVRALGPNTDRLAPAREIIGGYLDALGVPATQSRLVREASSLQAFNAAANNIVLGRQLEQRGVQTDGDREVMRQTFATITNTNEANDVILRAVEAQANRAMERAEFYQQWRQQPGANGRPRGTLDGASEAWNAYIRETPLVARTSNGLVFFNEWLPAALQNPQINGDREAALRLWRENARQRR